MNDKKLAITIAAATATIGVATYFYVNTLPALEGEVQKKPSRKFNVLVGDIGGTNVRLKLDRICLASKTRYEIKKYSTFNS